MLVTALTTSFHHPTAAAQHPLAHHWTTVQPRRSTCHRSTHHPSSYSPCIHQSQAIHHPHRSTPTFTTFSLYTFHNGSTHTAHPICNSPSQPIHRLPLHQHHYRQAARAKRPSLLSAINLCAQCDRPCSAVLSLHAPSICPSVRPSVCRVLLSGFMCKLQRRAECRVRGSHRSGQSLFMNSLNNSSE